MNLENLGVQEMNAKELVGVDGGGGLWDRIADAVISYVVENIIEAGAEAIADHCNNGAGYGGYMDTHGKL